MLIHVESYEQFQNEIKEGKVLVDFFAVWCGPCQMLSPIIEDIAENNPDIKVLKVDTDQVGKAAADYQVYSIPTLLYIENGQLIRKQVGFMPKPNVLRFIGK